MFTVCFCGYCVMITVETLLHKFSSQYVNHNWSLPVLLQESKYKGQGSTQLESKGNARFYAGSFSVGFIDNRL